VVARAAGGVRHCSSSRAGASQRRSCSGDGDRPTLRCRPILRGTLQTDGSGVVQSAPGHDPDAKRLCDQTGDSEGQTKYHAYAASSRAFDDRLEAVSGRYRDSFKERYRGDAGILEGGSWSVQMGPTVYTRRALRSTRTSGRLRPPLTPARSATSFSTPETVSLWQLPEHITVLRGRIGNSRGYRLQYIRCRAAVSAGPMVDAGGP